MKPEKSSRMTGWTVLALFLMAVCAYGFYLISIQGSSLSLASTYGSRIDILANAKEVYVFAKFELVIFILAVSLTIFWFFRRGVFTSSHLAWLLAGLFILSICMYGAAEITYSSIIDSLG